MIAEAERYNDAMYEALFGPDGIANALSDYGQAISAITSASGTSYGSMIENMQNMGEINNEALQSAIETIETLGDTLDPINDMTNAWNAHNETLQQTIAYYEQLANKINIDLADLGDVNAIAGAGRNAYADLDTAQLTDEIKHDIDVENMTEKEITKQYLARMYDENLTTAERLKLIAEYEESLMKAAAKNEEESYGRQGVSLNVSNGLIDYLAGLTQMQMSYYDRYDHSVKDRPS
ncbi:MAG: hypothetical protein E7270_00890 [Lachnospiraceae bacterium]|nr:hypothetical protein [Lachnospiraceae bacterium]